MQLNLSKDQNQKIHVINTLRLTNESSQLVKQFLTEHTSASMHLISHACFAKDIYEQQKYHGIIDSVTYPKSFPTIM